MPTLYILKCKDSCYFIGKTTGSYFKVIDDHFKGHGCEWTKLHKPIRLELLRHFCDENDDDFYTRLFMAKYGIDKVRGGSYSQLKLSENQLCDIYHYPIDMHLEHKRHISPFLRNIFDRKDTIEDIDEDNKNNEEHINNKKVNNNTLFLKRCFDKISYPVKVLLDCIFSHKLNNIMSIRLGRSGSFHKLYPYDVKNKTQL